MPTGFWADYLLYFMSLYLQVQAFLKIFFIPLSFCLLPIYSMYFGLSIAMTMLLAQHELLTVSDLTGQENSAWLLPSMPGHLCYCQRVVKLQLYYTWGGAVLKKGQNKNKDSGANRKSMECRLNNCVTYPTSLHMCQLSSSSPALRCPCLVLGHPHLGLYKR